MGQQQKSTASPAEEAEGSAEEELLERAKKELLRDVKCASMRAEQFGAHSWAKPQKYVPSKRFLRHMLVSASRNNRRTNDRLEKRKTKIMSTTSQGSPKKRHSSRKDKDLKKKRSRWDTSPHHKKSNSHEEKSSKGKTKS